MDNQPCADMLTLETKAEPCPRQSVALEVFTGREQKVMASLRRLGVLSPDSPLPGYVVAIVLPSRLPLIADIVGVRRVVCLAPGERFQSDVTPEEPALQSGDLVRINSGTYATLSGLLAEWDGAEGTVDVVMFGRSLAVRVQKCQIDAIPLPDPWK